MRKQFHEVWLDVIHEVDERWNAQMAFHWLSRFTPIVEHTKMTGRGTAGRKRNARKVHSALRALFKRFNVRKDAPVEELNAQHGLIELLLRQMNDLYRDYNLDQT